MLSGGSVLRSWFEIKQQHSLELFVERDGNPARVDKLGVKEGVFLLHAGLNVDCRQSLSSHSVVDVNCQPCRPPRLSLARSSEHDERPVLCTCEPPRFRPVASGLVGSSIEFEAERDLLGLALRH